MRLLLLYQPIEGGVARHVVDLVQGLRGRGHDAVLCGPALPSASRLSPPTLDAPFVRLSLQRAVAPAAEASALRHYASIVRRLRPDLVHAHSSKAGAIARLGKFLHPSVPVLYTPHGYAFAGYFHSGAERAAYREAERLLAPLTRFVIAVCHAEARLAASVGPATRVRVVHNGIAALQHRPADPGMLDLTRRGPVLCTVTQLRPGKGLETLIDALPAVLSRHPAQLAIVGGGPLLGELQARARARGVDHAVRFLGEHPDPLTVMQQADVFVMPSWAESFPYVILEAMGAGLAIVASDVGGIPEALSDGRSGLLVACGDSVATSRALVQLLDDPELRLRLGSSASRAATRFTRTAMVDGVARVYDEAVAAYSDRR